MLSPRPFVPSQWPLLHLVGILSIARTAESSNDNNANPAQVNNSNVLILPQELLLNALCFVTEQIHEVAEPYTTLHELLSDVERLATVRTGKNGKPVHVQDEQAKSSSSAVLGRRASTRSSPVKRVSISPVTSTTTRSLRKTASRTSLSSMVDMDDTPPPPGREPFSTVHAAKRLADKLRENVQLDVQGMVEDRFDALMGSVAEFRMLLGELDNPNSNSFLDRTSPLGMWIRRAILNLNNMTYSQVEGLITQIIEYVSPDSSSPSSAVSANLFATTHDPSSMQDTLRPRTETFESYLSSLEKADYQSSLTCLLRFFDYETYPFAGGSANNRGLRQHALLNLAQFHLENEEYSAARYACQEGIKVARQAGDLICLNALTSVMRRICFEDTSERNGNNKDTGALASFEVSKEDPGGYVPPTDHLWDIRFGLSNRVPLPALTCNLFRAKALHYASMTTKSNLSSKERKKEKKLLAAQGGGKDAANADMQQKKLKWNRLDRPSWVASSADLWERLGSKEVASTYGMIGSVMTGGKAANPSSVDVDPTNGSRMALLSTQAKQLAHEGAYETALALLLNEAADNSKIKMTVKDVQIWQRAVYNIFRLQAKRLDYDTVLQHINTVQTPPTSSNTFPRRPSSQDAFDSFTPLDMAGSTYDSQEYSGLIGEVDSCIKRAEKLLDVSQAASALPLASKAVTLSSLSDGQGLLRLNQCAHLQLARVQIAFNSPDRALRVLDEVWPNVLGSKNIELISKARSVRADCLMAVEKQARAESQATEEESAETLSEAVELFQSAEKGYKNLGYPSERVKVLSKLAKLHHQMGATEERDRVAKEWRRASNGIIDGGHGQREMLEQLYRVERICAGVAGRVAAN